MEHFHKATGKTDYIELKGDIVLDGVDFGYRDDKIVLHDVKMYAKPGQKLHLSAPRVPVRRQLPIFRIVSMIFRMVRSVMMASI